MSETVLSVLIPSVHTRRNTFGPRIQEQIFGQYESLSETDQDRVEVLMLTDTKSMILGHKRNVMIGMADGDYVVFVDDDDRLESDYVQTILDAIDESHADVITFLVSVTLNGHPPKLCRYSKDYEEDHNTATEYHRLPNHICVTKRDLAAQVPYPSIPYREDSGYSSQIRVLLKTEYAIDRVLYHYDYNVRTSETQAVRHRRRNAEILRHQMAERTSK